MSDLELLVLAAKAAGINHVDYTGIDYDGSLGLMTLNDQGNSSGLLWRPLTSDGDALRLASEMNMVLKINGPYVSAGDDEKILVTEETFTMDQRMPGIRRAIVRAAAEIWISMK